MENNAKITIIINTCDAYSDVLRLFLHAFNEHWQTCSYPIIINTESSDPGFVDERITVSRYIKYNGVDKWGDRLKSVLRSIDSEFVLMLYDDFILEDAVNINGMNKGIELLKAKSNVSSVYLINTSLPTEGGTSYYQCIKDRTDYILNSAPALWRRADLLKFTGKEDTPWAWEVFGSYRTHGSNNIFYTLNPNNIDVFPYNYSKGGAIYRGKWVKEVIDGKFEKYNLDIDPTIRGFINKNELAPRTLQWKWNFILTGFRMIGFRAFYFLLRNLKIKATVK